MHKFGALRDGVDVPFVYPDIWQREHTTGPDRLVIAPSRGHVGLLLQLARTWTSDYWLLYVLLVSRTDRAEGRYQSPAPLTYAELEAFLRQFAAFLATDGRHHFWIGSTEGEGTLVYDHHDVVYAYGPLDEYVAVLRAGGFHEAPVRFPDPHTHHYNAENDDAENALLSHWDWRHSPLQPGDER